MYRMCKFIISLVTFSKHICTNLERPNFLNIISVFMSYIDKSLFRTNKTIGLPVKSNWRSWRNFVFYSYVCRTYIHSLFIGKISPKYLKQLSWNETYTLLSNFYHNKLNISRILKEDKLFGVQYLQRIRVIVNESIVTHLLCALNMLIIIAAAQVIKNSKHQRDT